MLILLFNLLVSVAHAQDCSIFEICGRASQTVMKSLPSLGSAADFNPSNLAHVNGLKAEILYRSHNKVQYNILTGSADVGAGLISPLAENAFFGNRSIELDQEALIRNNAEKNYESKKLQFATGFSLVNSDSLGFDLGASLRRHADLKKINLGVGTSLRLHYLNFGFQAYYDDASLDFKNYINPRTNNSYNFDYGSQLYQEKFLVKTFSAGLSIGNFSFDTALINTKYNFYQSATSILFVSSSYYLDEFLVNVAYRQEKSDNLSVRDGRSKKDQFVALQYSWRGSILIGIVYNNFLQKDLTVQLIIGI